MLKSEFDKYEKVQKGFLKGDLIVQQMINDLIRSCYEPCETGLHARSDVVDDAVNWEDLKCFDVKECTDGSFVAYIDEAAPEAHDFRQWVEGWLRKWGWEVEVITEW